MWYKRVDKSHPYLQSLNKEYRAAISNKDEAQRKLISRKEEAFHIYNAWKEIINIPDFDTILEKVIYLLIINGVRTIEPIEGSDVSIHERNAVTTNGREEIMYEIFINKERRKNKVEIIFDMLHEFGHSLDKEEYSEAELEANSLKCQKREIIAWLNAESEFLKIPELKNYSEDFEKYKWKCLESYGIRKVAYKRRKKYQSLFNLPLIYFSHFLIG